MKHLYRTYVIKKDFAINSSELKFKAGQMVRLYETKDNTYIIDRFGNMVELPDAIFMSAKKYFKILMN